MTTRPIQTGSIGFLTSVRHWYGMPVPNMPVQRNCDATAAWEPTKICEAPRHNPNISRALKTSVIVAHAAYGLSDGMRRGLLFKTAFSQLRAKIGQFA